MTDTSKFREIVRISGIPMYKVAEHLGISPQSLYNKIGNATQFTQSEMIKFREIFPNVSDEEFNQIFLKGEHETLS